MATTHPSKFRYLREQGVEKTLAGFGRTIRMRPPRLEVLLRAGNIPDILTPLVLKMIYVPLSNEEINEFLGDRDNIKEAKEQLDSLNLLCEEVLIEPRVVKEITDPETQILIDDLTLLERGWIFKWAMLPAEYLAVFRAEQEGDVGVVPDSAEHEQPTEHAAEHFVAPGSLPA